MKNRSTPAHQVVPGSAEEAREPIGVARFRAAGVKGRTAAAAVGSTHERILDEADEVLERGVVAVDDARECSRVGDAADELPVPIPVSSAEVVAECLTDQIVQRDLRAVRFEH